MRTVLAPVLGSGVLVGIVVLLGFGLMGQIAQEDSGRDGLAEPESGTALVASASSDTARLPTRPEVYFAAITERPIFAPTRRPVQAARDEKPAQTVEVTAPLLEQDEVPLAVQVHGIRGQGDAYSALLSSGGQTPEWLDPGASIGGWKVSEIGSDWIIMNNGENSQRVELYQ
ncbi:hypothetical protein ACXYMP_16020 [Aliiroseovarius sp. CAU 1755]